MEKRSPTRQTSLAVNFVARAKHLTPIEEYVLLAIVTTCAHYGMLYCWIKRETIQGRVCAWYGYPVSLSTIDRAIRRVRDLKLLRRQLRTTKDDSGKKIWTSSLTYLLHRVKDLLARLLKLPKAISACFRLSSLTNYSFTKEKYPGRGDSARGSPKAQGDEKGCPAGSNSSYLPPQHNLPAETKALWKKMGLLEG
jgi:hypothetical protein